MRKLHVLTYADILFDHNLLGTSASGRIDKYDNTWVTDTMTQQWERDKEENINKSTQRIDRKFHMH